MKSIAVVTVGRSDFGIYLPVLRVLRRSQLLRPRIIAAAAHLNDEHGRTAREIECLGFEIDAQVPMTSGGDSRSDIAHSAGTGLVGFSAALEHIAPDMVLVLGDRFEMHAAALAGTFAGIPLAHIHGGELSLGAWDDALRHSITKLSHLHFVSTDEHARRVRQLGEESWRVHVTGAPALDNLRQIDAWDLVRLEHHLQLALPSPPLLVTYHPVTTQLERTGFQLEALATVIAEVADRGRPVIITRPNADPANRQIVLRFQALAADRANVRFVENLGTEPYFNLMRHAAAMLGNSSSGIVEAASFELPVINVGDRQAGRARSANVLDVPCELAPMRRALGIACSAEFRRSLHRMGNVYGDGNAAPRIVELLESLSWDDRLINKRFMDWPEAA
ncbi:MAG: UDP-N-acetylglucosamine 2-epimerase (hydrolyzing) [Planctomycetes bacterium]|nr:UDP-N-acetylglucosamine 2-epimerase (hydrolyzing) [Planctomycetota bacterium]